MTHYLSIFSATLAGALGIAAISRNPRSYSAVLFGAGMLVLSCETVFEVMILRAGSAVTVGEWQAYATIARAAAPVCWIGFSVLYCRGKAFQTLRPWLPLLCASLFLPIIAAFSAGHLFDVWETDSSSKPFWIHFLPSAKVLNAIFLIYPVLILMNLERTFRSAVGTQRWRIKFVLLGVAILFGVRFYTRSQAVIFSGENVELYSLDAVALLIGCVFIITGYVRGGFGEIDLYPSRAVLQASFTVILAGAYLFAVGILAPLIARIAQPGLFPVAALFVLIALIVLSMILVSDRLRQKTRSFVSRNFQRPEHDFRAIWTNFTRNVAPMLDEERACSAACRLISETFDVLSVSIWRFDRKAERLTRIASTGGTAAGEGASEVEVPGLEKAVWPARTKTIALSRIHEKWTESLQACAGETFRDGGGQFALPLFGPDGVLGLIVLADRVSGVSLTSEELDLLTCVADQLTATIRSARLAREIAAAREIEAFQRMSAFFVHDLKNTASSLALMLQNFEAHFDDVAFRTDMLQGIRSANQRINQLIGGLSGFRSELRLSLRETDLNDVVRAALKQLNGSVPVPVDLNLNSLPPVSVDAEKLQSVFVNLLVNAGQALRENGKIKVDSGVQGDYVSVSVSDNGVGMPDRFIRESLFQPFQTTKKKGLGIGLFQARMIVEAHGGTIQVQSTPGTGSSFQVAIPFTVSK